MIRLLLLLVMAIFPVRVMADPVFELPRNPSPVGSYTSQFQKKQFLSTLGGTEKVMTYFFRMPPVKDPKQKLPLVLVLHGGSGWAHAAMYLTMSTTPKFYPAFIAVPVLGTGRMWAWPEGDKTGRKGGPDGLNDAVVLVTQLLRDYPIDPDRVYVIGCSDGGTGVFGAARYYPQVFAAGIAASGLWDPLDAPHMTKMPFLFLYAGQDKVMSPELSKMMAISLTQAKAQVKSVAYPHLAHQCDAPDFYVPKYLSWLFSQKRRVPSVPPQTQNPVPAAKG